MTLACSHCLEYRNNRNSGWPHKVTFGTITQSWCSMKPLEQGWRIWVLSKYWLILCLFPSHLQSLVEPVLKPGCLAQQPGSLILIYSEWEQRKCRRNNLGVRQDSGPKLRSPVTSGFTVPAPVTEAECERAKRRLPWSRGGGEQSMTPWVLSTTLSRLAWCVFRTAVLSSFLGGKRADAVACWGGEKNWRSSEVLPVW